MSDSHNSIEEALRNTVPSDDKKISFEPGVIDGGLSAEMCLYVRRQREKVIGQMEDDGIEQVDINVIDDIYTDSAKSLPVAAMKLEKAAVTLKELLEQSQHEIGHLSTLLEVRENTNYDGFVDKLRDEIAELTESVMNVIAKVESRGVEYFMDNNKYNDELAVDIENLLSKLNSGKKVVSDCILSSRLKEYDNLKVDNAREVRMLFGDDDQEIKYYPEEGDHNLELEKIELLKAMASNTEFSVKKLQDSLLRLTKFSFQHRAGTLNDSGKYAQKSKDGKGRLLDEEFEDHPEILKMEYLLGNLVVIVRATVNANVIKNQFYLSEETAEYTKNQISMGNIKVASGDFM